MILPHIECSRSTFCTRKQASIVPYCTGLPELKKGGSSNYIWPPIVDLASPATSSDEASRRLILLHPTVDCRIMSSFDEDGSPDWEKLSDMLSPNALAALQSHLQSNKEEPHTTSITTTTTSSADTTSLPVAVHNGVFKEKSYWEERFTVEAEYDWLLTFDKLKPHLLPLLKSMDHILIVGCGNSSLSADLYDAGFIHITNIDFSPVVIEKMKMLNENDRPGMKWVVQDMTDLQFRAGSFDVVLDKASMDALMVSEVDVWDPEEDTILTTDRMCQCVTKVLTQNGRFIQLSFAQPHFRTKYLMGVHLDRMAVAASAAATVEKKKDQGSSSSADASRPSGATTAAGSDNRATNAAGEGSTGSEGRLDVILGDTSIGLGNNAAVVDAGVKESVVTDDSIRIMSTVTPYDVVQGRCDRYRWSLSYKTIDTEAGCLNSFLYVMKRY